VTEISLDAIVDEKRGPVYSSRIKLLQNRIKVDGKVVMLSSGMSLIAEIITGWRQVISYL